MRYTSLREEWPLTHESVFLRWTTDGVIYHEQIIKEADISKIECLGIPEWRPTEEPEWLKEVQQHDG